MFGGASYTRASEKITEKRRVIIMKRLLILGFIMGMIYYTLEGFWRGWSNIAMLFVGGLCGVLVGLLDEYPQFIQLKIWQQTLIAWPLVTMVEFIAGFILNIWLGLGIWDYAGLPGSIYGQVCLPYAALWLFLIPFGIWLDDWLRWKFFDQEKPPELISIYRDLITLK